MTETKPIPSTNVPGSRRRIRVLFVNDTSRNGGPGRTLLDILKFLDPEYVHRTVLIPREGIVSGRLRDAGVADAFIFEPDLIENLFEPLSRPMERADFAAHVAVKAWRSGANILRATGAVLRLVRTARRFDLVFCNGTSANFAGGAIAVMARVPVIWHCFYPSVAPAIRPLHDRLAAARFVRAIVCVSAAAARQFAPTGGKVRIIHDAVDVDEFDGKNVEARLRQEFGLDSATVIIGAHGRILRRKGYIELIRSARIMIDLLDAGERSRCRFFIVGDTPEDMRPNHLQECRNLVRELGLSDFVQFIGFRADVRPYIADFDVAVVPSVYDDPLPRAVMEPMAMGKPVVAFASGGIVELLTDGVEGRLVPGSPPDIPGLANACLAYFRKPELRMQHGAAARQRIERDFHARVHAQILQDMMFRFAESGVPHPAAAVLRW